MERLKILMFMPSKVDAVGINHEFVTQLAHNLDAQADIKLLHTLQGIKAETLSKQQLIHIFGCWDTAAINLQQKAHKLHIPTIYSPLGTLQPWIAKKHRSTYLYALQKKAIQQSSAIHICSKLEGETFGQLGWNTKTAEIKNAVVTNQLTFTEMTHMLWAFYHKVLDSNVHILLGAAACRAINDLLELGANADTLFDDAHCQSMKANIDTLTDQDRRQIMIYAHQEHVTDFLTTGFERIHVAAPDINVQLINRFDRAIPYSDSDLQTNELSYKNNSQSKQVSELTKDTETTERELCFALLNFKHGLEHHTAPLRHFLNLYTLIRFGDTNEDRMKELVKELGIDDFAARLMAVMQEALRLSEGFMPFAVQNDKTARLMYRNITKYNVWT